MQRLDDTLSWLALASMLVDFFHSHTITRSHKIILISYLPTQESGLTQTFLSRRFHRLATSIAECLHPAQRLYALTLCLSGNFVAQLFVVARNASLNLLCLGVVSRVQNIVAVQASHPFDKKLASGSFVLVFLKMEECAFGVPEGALFCLSQTQSA